MPFLKATAREQAKEISRTGKTHHIGKKSVAVLQQEYFSIRNTKNRDKKFLQKAWDLKKEIDLDFFSQLQNKYNHLPPYPKDFSEIGK